MRVLVLGVGYISQGSGWGALDRTRLISRVPELLGRMIPSLGPLVLKLWDMPLKSSGCGVCGWGRLDLVQRQLMGRIALYFGSVGLMWSFHRRRGNVESIY